MSDDIKVDEKMRQFLLEKANKACEGAWGYKKPPYSPLVTGQKWMKAIPFTRDLIERIEVEPEVHETVMRLIENIVINWNEGIRHTKVMHPLMAVMDKQFNPEGIAYLVFYAIYDKKSFKAQYS